MKEKNELNSNIKNLTRFQGNYNLYIYLDLPMKERVAFRFTNVSSSLRIIHVHRFMGTEAYPMVLDITDIGPQLACGNRKV